MKRKTARKIKLSIAMLAVFVVYIWLSSSRLIIDAGGEYFAFSVSNCSYYAIEESIKSRYVKDLCTIEKTADGKVACVKTDVVGINALSAKLATDCYNALDSLVADGFPVPCGVFTGIRLLAGSGKKVKIKLMGVLSVQCDMVREFSSVGINQTRYTLSAFIHADLSVYTPLGYKRYLEKIEVPLFDNFIVGEVPNVYLSSEVVGSWKKSSG